MNSFKDLVVRNRSYRRFDESYFVERDVLLCLVDLARCSASGRNLQPLKYFVSNDKAVNAKIFPTLAWAGFSNAWDGPVVGERPSAYIFVLGDTSVSTHYFCDDGIAMQSMLLGAVEQGLGGCIVGAIRRDDLRAALDIPEKYEILYVLALGKPIDVVVLEEMNGDDFMYWRDENNVHHVPKRSLKDVVIDKFE